MFPREIAHTVILYLGFGVSYEDTASSDVHKSHSLKPIFF
jgi:hypothetical protein